MEKVSVKTSQHQWSPRRREICILSLRIAFMRRFCSNTLRPEIRSLRFIRKRAHKNSEKLLQTIFMFIVTASRYPREDYKIGPRTRSSSTASKKMVECENAADSCPHPVHSEDFRRNFHPINEIFFRNF